MTSDLKGETGDNRVSGDNEKMQRGDRARHDTAETRLATDDSARRRQPCELRYIKTNMRQPCSWSGLNARPAATKVMTA